VAGVRADLQEYIRQIMKQRMKDNIILAEYNKGKKTKPIISEGIIFFG
jgi:hypothetical protein